MKKYSLLQIKALDKHFTKHIPLSKILELGGDVLQQIVPPRIPLSTVILQKRQGKRSF